MRRILLVCTGLVLVLTGYGLGRSDLPVAPLAAAQAVASTADQGTYDFRDYPRTWQLIKEHHIDTEVKDRTLFYGSIKGMVEALDDPYSNFFDPQEAEMARTEMAGVFSGIGATVGKKDGRIIIVAPMEGSPAERAGLKPDDVIVKIDGEETYRMSLNDAVMQIRGTKGTTVTLTIWREEFKEPKDFPVLRDDIVTVSVKWHTVAKGKKTYMVIRISGFHEDTNALFGQAAQEALAMKVNGIVLDLRTNPGGRLDAALGVSCHWLPEGPAAWHVPRGEPAEALECDGRGPLQKMPTVVLVNKYSASASEITTGALQDLKKAYVIGEQTYGKGCGQSIIKYPDGAELHLTTFLWETPLRRSINKTGVTPDEVMKAVEDDGKDGKDSVLDRAIQYLHQGH